MGTSNAKKRHQTQGRAGNRASPRRLALALGLALATLPAKQVLAASTDPFGANCKAYGTCTDGPPYGGGKVIRDMPRLPPVKPEPYRTYRPKLPSVGSETPVEIDQRVPSHMRWCRERYRSYRASDNSWKPLRGPRRQCVSPVM